MCYISTHWIDKSVTAENDVVLTSTSYFDPVWNAFSKHTDGSIQLIPYISNDKFSQEVIFDHWSGSLTGYVHVNQTYRMSLGCGDSSMVKTKELVVMWSHSVALVWLV
jgi:hypothetical protein